MEDGIETKDSNETQDKVETTEKMELSHEPVRGYPLIFYTVLAVAIAYLVWIFVQSPAHH